MSKLVVYTCICGDYDNLVQHGYVNPEVDYVCFTNNKILLNYDKIGIWEIRPLCYDKLDNTKNARWHKTHPHILFPEYEASIWLDGNGNILTDYFYKMIDKRGINLLVPQHFSRDCLYDECEECRNKKETAENCDKVFQFMQNEQMPRHYGLNETNIIYRRHHDENIKNIMDIWWWCIENNSKRDQLSFTYALWKNGVQVKDISIPNARQNIKHFKFHSHSKDGFVSHKIYNFLGVKIKVKCDVLDDYKNFFVIANDKFVAPLAKLVNEYMLANKFNTAIIVTPGRDISEFPIPQYDNVYYLNFNQIKFPSATRRIIWQGLSKSAVDYLYKHKSLLKKSFWTIFGGDLYGAQQNRKNDYVRKNFKALITGHDYDFYKRRYHVEKDVYQAVTPSPVWNFEQLSSLRRNKKDFVSVQINQSANRYTVDMLQKLARFANENIRVYTIMSYGDMDYKEQIEQTGKEIFGDKFVPISTWMNTEEYAKHLADIDVFIHYDDRQSAFGNICCSMYLGAKVYVRNDLDYWKDFISMDCQVYDVNQIDEITFSDISNFTKEIREHNRKVISEFFAMKNIASKWEHILKYA